MMARALNFHRLKEPRSTILTEAEGATAVAFRRPTVLALEVNCQPNDPGDRLSRRTPLCLVAIPPTSDAFIDGSVPAAMSHCGATGSCPMANASLSCPTRKATGRSARSSSAPPSALAIELEPMADAGSIHVDIAEVQTAEDKLSLFVEKADRKTAWEFLQHMLEALRSRTPRSIASIMTSMTSPHPSCRRHGRPHLRAKAQDPRGGSHPMDTSARSGHPSRTDSS